MFDKQASVARVDRRRFLAATGTLAGALAATRIPEAWAAAQTQAEYPFTLSVASGEPRVDGGAVDPAGSPAVRARRRDACRRRPGRVGGCHQSRADTGHPAWLTSRDA
jgi:hypothetical protein